MKTEITPHVRLTPEQVRALFELGHLKPTGYLYLLLAALKQHGWKHRVESVHDFCSKWGINRSTFYRSKAKLIADGLLDEDIIGAVDLSTREVSSLGVPELGLGVPELGLGVPELGLSVPELGLSVPELGLSVPELGQTRPEVVENTGFQGFPNSSSALLTECLSTLESPHSLNAHEENPEMGVGDELCANSQDQEESKTTLPLASQPAPSPRLFHSPPPQVPSPPPSPVLKIISFERNSSQEFENAFNGRSQIEEWKRDTGFLVWLEKNIILDGKPRDRGFVLSWMRNRVREGASDVVEAKHECYVAQIPAPVDPRILELKAQGHQLYDGETYEQCLELIAEREALWRKAQ